MRYLFFINPMAGKGVLQGKIAQSIRQYFAEKGGNYRIHFTRFAGDAKAEARREAETGEEIRMFACGGEGTGLEVINGIAGFSNVSFGSIPCGSANDFLKFFGGEKEPFLDIAAQVEGEAIPVDLIRANDTYCLNNCSVGMDAVVARDMSLFKRWPLVSGQMAYKLAIVKTFLRKIGVTISLSLDDQPAKAVRCLFAVIANAPFYGGGYQAAPAANPFDGVLNFTQVDVISKAKVPAFLSRYQNGKHGDLPYCRLDTCHSMSFESEAPIPVNLDGEIVECRKMRFELVEKALPFVVPKGLLSKVLTNV